jgi:NADH:ubiquinone oxidoreductase subunit D
MLFQRKDALDLVSVVLCYEVQDSMDLRKVNHEIYNKLNFDIAVGNHEIVTIDTKLGLLEMKQSIRIIEQCRDSKRPHDKKNNDTKITPPLRAHTKSL